MKWYTGKPCEHAAQSHSNVCVYDSTWEASKAFELDHNPVVNAWVKNDHLSFEVFYVHRGVVRKYRPDFLIRLKSGNMLVLETKGWDSDQNRTKRRFLDEWTRRLWALVLGRVEGAQEYQGESRATHTVRGDLTAESQMPFHFIRATSLALRNP